MSGEREYDVSLEVPSNVPGLRNYRVPISGSSVVASLGVHDNDPERWIYSLWDEADNELDMISVGTLDLTGLTVTPSQVGRIAFILDVEYGGRPVN